MRLFPPPAHERHLCHTHQLDSLNYDIRDYSILLHPYPIPPKMHVYILPVPPFSILAHFSKYTDNAISTCRYFKFAMLLSPAQWAHFRPS